MAGRFTLYDARGREVDLDALRQPPAIRSPVKTTKAFELDPESVILLFKAADGGDPRELQAIAGELERRDGHMGGQIRTRRRAASRLTFGAETPADTKTDGGLAGDVVAAVKRDILDAIWCKRLVFDLLDANLKGYSVAEIAWETTADVWRPRAVTWVDQRLTAIDLVDGLTVRWRDPADQAKTIDIAPYTAVVHASGDVSGPLWTRGLMRVLAILYSIKRLGVRAWAAFVELYGVPRILATVPTQWSQAQVDDFMFQLESWGQAGFLVAKAGATVQPQQASSSQNASEAAHQALAGWCDEQASLAILGQTMTATNGASRAQAEVHQEVAEWILESDAWEVAGTLTRDLVEPYVRLNFGEDAPVPVITPQILGSAAREFRLRALKDLIPLGLRVEQSVARDLAGVPEPSPTAEILTGTAPGSSGGAAGAPAVGAPSGARAAAATSIRTTRLAEADGQDFIDRDGDAAAWRETMRPLVDVVEAAGREAQGGDDAAKYADFLARVEAGVADGDKLVKSISAWTMQARGVGDGTDEVA